jgi:predicted nucleic acid-binding protein
MTVLDASVQVALLNGDDAHHRWAMAWKERSLTAGEAHSAPWILVAEVAAAIRRGQGDAARAKEAARHIIHGGQLQLVAVVAELATEAAAIASDQGIRGCDAVYVALAAALGEPLVTLDRRQAERRRRSCR